VPLAHAKIFGTQAPLSATENISALAGENFYISGLRAKIKTQALAHRRGKITDGRSSHFKFYSNWRQFVVRSMKPLSLGRASAIMFAVQNFLLRKNIAAVTLRA